MTWTEQQLAELKRENARIGFLPHELLPAPPEHLTPDDILALYRTIPNGAGRAGLFQALANLPQP